MAETEEPNSKDLDSLLSAEIGGFGRYQLRTLALCALVTFMAASSSEYVFSTGRIPTRCRIPECDTGPNPEMNPPWLAHASPGGCERYSNNTNHISHNVSKISLCPAYLFNMSHIMKCDKFVYENSNTIVYDFDLGCDEWKRTAVGSFGVAGMFISLPFTGFISDRFGRRIAISLNAFNLGWAGLMRYWSNSYWMFVLMKIAEFIVGAAGFTCSYVIMTELVNPKYRPIAGSVMHSTFAMGTAAVALVAWLAQGWRTMTLYLYAPQLLFITYFWVMDDSVRWLLSKQRYDESERLLKKIAKTNKNPSFEKSIQEIITAAKDQKTALETREPENEAWLLIQVFKCKPVLVNCLIAPIWWVTMTFVYYGMGVSSVGISGNPYVNFAAVALADIVGYGSGMTALRYVGRRTMLLVAYWTCAACLAGFIALPTEFAWGALVLYLGGKACMAAAAMGIYVYTAELFPTKHRHSLLAYASMLGRVGSVVAPIAPALGDTLFKEFPFVVFIGMCLLSGALLFFTPETRGSRLPDTMEEAAYMGTNKK